VLENLRPRRGPAVGARSTDLSGERHHASRI